MLILAIYDRRCGPLSIWSAVTGLVRLVTYVAGSIILTSIGRRFRNVMALRLDEKLLAHFSKAGTAIFAVKELEKDGHGDPPSFDHGSRNLCSLPSFTAREVI
jgi:hypothetical protein